MLLDENIWLSGQNAWTVSFKRFPRSAGSNLTTLKVKILGKDEKTDA